MATRIGVARTLRGRSARMRPAVPDRPRESATLAQPGVDLSGGLVVPEPTPSRSALDSDDTLPPGEVAGRDSRRVPTHRAFQPAPA